MATNSTSRVTIKSTLQTIIDKCGDILSPAEMDKVKTMLEQTEKKSASRKAKTSDTDMALMATVKECLSADNGITVTEVRNASSELIALSTPKVTALLGKLADNGEVVRFTDKRKVLWKLA